VDSITLKAPAKINLFLRVLGRRPDGYHTIETLFEKIDLFDRISLKKDGDGISVCSDDKRVPSGRENIAFRAAELLRDKHNLSLDVKIEIEKSIPIGAGLGGGSSDAAAVLIGIDKLYNIGLTSQELELLAKELGADVPFFVSNKTWAVGRERGDKIEAIDTNMSLWHILIVPPFSILSKDAYEWTDKRVTKEAPPDINKALFSIRRSDTTLLGKNLYNTLEGISLEKTDLLNRLKKRLIECGAKGALISGSGPVLFGIAEGKKEVKRLKEEIEKTEREMKEWQIIITPTLYDQ